MIKRKVLIAIFIVFSFCLISCNDNFNNNNKHIHSFKTIIEDSTCIKEGSSVEICECGEKRNQQVIAATGHIEEIISQVNATCTSTGLTEGKKCSVCGEVLVEQIEIPVNGHTYIDDICHCGHKNPNASLYKEIEIDEKLLYELDSHKCMERYSNFYRIFQNGWEEHQSVPILEFSEIDDKYIGVYVDKVYMDLIRKEASESERDNSVLEKVSIEYYKSNHLSYPILLTYYNIINNKYTTKYYTIEGKLINKENVGVKYYQLDKNNEIPIEIDGYEIMGLYGTRKVTVIDDLYVKETIGNEYQVYFEIPVTITNDQIISEEDYFYTYEDKEERGADSYNSFLRKKSINDKYLYASNQIFEKSIECSSCFECYISIMFEENGIEYLAVPEFGIINKTINGLAYTELLQNLNKELSKKVTYELVLKYHTIGDTMTSEEYVDYYIENYGYTHEVYDYNKILEIIDDYFR